jgi:hypothetical protein
MVYHTCARNILGSQCSSVALVPAASRAHSVFSLKHIHTRPYEQFTQYVSLWIVLPAKKFAYNMSRSKMLLGR